MDELKCNYMDDNTKALLEQLAAKLGTTADNVWQILINQAFLSGWLSIMWALFFAILTYCLFRYLKANRDEDPDPIVFFSYILILGSVVIIPVNIHEAVIAFSNPDYWALKEILGTIER